MSRPDTVNPTRSSPLSTPMLDDNNLPFDRSLLIDISSRSPSPHTPLEPYGPNAPALTSRSHPPRDFLTPPYEVHPCAPVPYSTTPSQSPCPFSTSHDIPRPHNIPTSTQISTVTTTTQCYTTSITTTHQYTNPIVSTYPSLPISTNPPYFTSLPVRSSYHSTYPLPTTQVYDRHAHHVPATPPPQPYGLDSTLDPYYPHLGPPVNAPPLPSYVKHPPPPATSTAPIPTPLARPTNPFQHCNTLLKDKQAFKVLDNFLRDIGTLDASNVVRLVEQLNTLNAAYELGLIADRNFIVYALPNTRGYLNKLWREAIKQDLSWPQLTNRVQREFLPARTLRRVINETIYRLQAPQEPFNTFIADITDKAQLLLPDLSELEIVTIILQNMNPTTRRTIVFQTTPSNLDDLYALASSVTEIVDAEREYRETFPQRRRSDGEHPRTIVNTQRNRQTYQRQERTPNYPSYTRQERPTTFFSSTRNSPPRPPASSYSQSYNRPNRSPPRSPGPSHAYNQPPRRSPVPSHSYHRTPNYSTRQAPAYSAYNGPSNFRPTSRPGPSSATRSPTHTPAPLMDTLTYGPPSAAPLNNRREC